MNKTNYSGNLPVLLKINCFFKYILRISPCIIKNTVTSVTEVQSIKVGSRKEFIFNRKFI